MATVFQRFQKLGLAHSNPILQLCGEHVAKHLGHFDEYLDNGITKVRQIEGSKSYIVNNYPENRTNRLDQEILNWVFNATRNGRKRTQQERDWWKHYKGLPR